MIVFWKTLNEIYLHNKTDIKNMTCSLLAANNGVDKGTNKNQRKFLNAYNDQPAQTIPIVQLDKEETVNLKRRYTPEQNLLRVYSIIFCNQCSGEMVRQDDKTGHWSHRKFSSTKIMLSKIDKNYWLFRTASSGKWAVQNGGEIGNR